MELNEAANIQAHAQSYDWCDQAELVHDGSGEYLPGTGWIGRHWSVAVWTELNGYSYPEVLDNYHDWNALRAIMEGTEISA